VENPGEFAPFRTTICGVAELDGHCAAGVTHVVSVLDPEWPALEAFDGELFVPQHKGVNDSALTGTSCAS